MPSQGDLQTTWNLIEATNDARQDVKAFRTHCDQISKKVDELNRTILPFRNATPEFAAEEAARDAIEPLNAALEECLGLLRKCATIGVMEKMFDKGETKGALEGASHRLNIAFQQFSSWLTIARSASGSKAGTSVTKERVEKVTESPAHAETAGPMRSAAPVASASQPGEKRPSSSQIYPDLL
ncbi:hypothetical protein KFL_002330030 [Klebsormidium nitens]|uniref:DUF7792 domain-containing protein n=1 Tax=Klebsormidium nitens TaxID=105231 RepID=A0A1Y1I4H0_KLENI|nr:hypothetical protein KFL_002330030 [Klebsormidium nitens]|eukprot:GAQ85393.1 hypothetical protein KFL_002330030 [Klebsormidium nitens]